MQYVVYKRPAVSDEHYDEYSWEQDRPPFDTRKEARDAMPRAGSEVGQGYNYALASYEDDEEIELHLSDSEMRDRRA